MKLLQLLSNLHIVFNIFFAIAVFYDLDIKQIDIKTGFFYNIIDQLFYIEISKNMNNNRKIRSANLKKHYTNSNNHLSSDINN